MPKSTASITERIQKLEEQKQALIIKRRNEVLRIIEATGSLTIDDKLLAGLLLFLKDEKNKDDPILDRIKSYLPKTKTNKSAPSKEKS